MKRHMSACRRLLRGVLLCSVGLCLFLSTGRSLLAQDLDTIKSSSVDLSQITDAFVRNMSLLDKCLSETMHDEDTHQMMLVVIAKAGDVSRYYRSGGGADKRRKLLEQQDALKKKAGFNKADQARLDDLNKQIQTTDPDSYFTKSRSDLGQSIGELQRYLGLYQTADVTVTDIIRLVREHLQYYQTAVGKYQ